MEEENVIPETENVQPALSVASGEEEIRLTNPDADEEPAAPCEENTADAIDYEQLMQEDLRALTAEFPDLAAMRSITDLPDPMRYATLRDLGLTPREAYLATLPVRPAPHARYDNRSHLHSTVPREARGATGAMDAQELARMRELFDGMDDASLQKLYRRVTG